MLPFKISCLLAIINVNPDHFVHITPIARVKNCSLFELVKTNNQDQLKGDKIKPKYRQYRTFLDLRSDDVCNLCGIFSNENAATG